MCSFPLCSRTLAESSPYFEALKQKDVEVLFCYEPYDELVLMQLRQFDSHNLTSVEKEMRQDRESDDLTDLGKYVGTQCSEAGEIANSLKLLLFSQHVNYENGFVTLSLSSPPPQLNI